MAHHLRQHHAVLIAAAAVWLSTSAGSVAPKFLADDPLIREPESQDASAAQPFEIDLGAELLINLFATPRSASAPAGNTNTIDEVPDSSWFTNRIYARPVTADEITRGPNTMEGPAPGRWTVIGAKVAGAAPGFRVRDVRGDVWFLTLDAKGWPRAGTGAIAVACRLFWALGYNQVESYLSSFRPEQLVIAESARVEPRPGYKRPMTTRDIESVLARAARDADGSYRVLAARAIPGKILGGFRYSGTRPDDPNDVVPHERRRELRALKVFAAWTNLTDLKALNTLDSLVDAGGRSLVRHYLQDVGSTFGAGANGPHDWDEGREYLYEGDATWRRLITGGGYLRPWQRDPYYEHPEIGRIEARGFNPDEWKPRTPTAAIAAARDDDTFWAALRVAAFSDDLIRAAVHEARYTDPAAESLLTKVLIERRDIIARTYLPRITPLVRFALDRNGELTFENAAVAAGVAGAPADGYRAEWYAFDNATHASESLGQPTIAREARIAAPSGWSRVAPTLSYLRVAVAARDAAHGDWARPIDVYFRRTADRWQLVGLERTVN